MTATFKEVAKRRLRIGVPLDFGQQRRRIDNQGMLEHVDCEKAVFDLALPSTAKDREFRQSTLSGACVPVLFLPRDKPDRADILQIKNHQLSWWFDEEPLKAVLKDSATFGMGLWCYRRRVSA